jgi:hypothetical protein
MATQSGYSKLSRRIGSMMTYHQLWKGSDHLMLVKEVGCTEEYKRFYFKDIQAVVTTRSISYLVWALVLLILTLGMAGAGFSETDPVSKTISFTVMGASLLFLLIHLSLGPTCKCWLHTGINREKLVIFRRTRQVLRFLGKIEPEITKAQGEFPTQAMNAHNPATDNTPTSSFSSGTDVGQHSE